MVPERTMQLKVMEAKVKKLRVTSKRGDMANITRGHEAQGTGDQQEWREGTEGHREDRGL
jgi:hypothetical protein